MTLQKTKQRIHISIAFGDTILPIIECDDGHQRVPLKPISDQIGLDWKSQKRKIINDEYLTDRFGLILGEACLPQMAQVGLKNDQYLIRLNRVTSFLNILNPQQITSQGNTEAANWLKTKHIEWDDVLHNYEQSGVAHSNDPAISELVRIDRIKNPELKRLASVRANKLYGLDIPVAKQTTVGFE